MGIEDKVIWGGLYEVNHHRWDDKQIGNDQIYYQAVPAMDKDGNVWMQDTHQLRSGSYKDGSLTLGAMERIFNLKDPNKGHWAIYTSRGDWYHTGNEKIISEEMLDDYELICDLHEYRPLNKYEDYRDYDTQDVLHGIHLYQEHGYSWDHGDIGVTLIKNDAKPILYNKWIASIADVNGHVRYPDGFSLSFDNMVEYYLDLLKTETPINPRDQVKYENTLWLVDRLKEMRNEIDQYMEEHKYRDHYDFEDSDLKLGMIHPDMERYLKEDCYCPGEIYGLDGFGYQIYTIDNPCQIVSQNDQRCAVVARTDDSSYPQILIFWYDDEGNPGKIIDAQRIDATQNNLETVKLLVDGQTIKDRKVDEFESGATAEFIQVILNMSDAIIVD